MPGNRHSYRDHKKSDERILGDSDFPDNILSFSGEYYERRHDLGRRGYDADRIVYRMAEILEMRPHEILSKSRKKREVIARSLLCHWAVRELGLSLTELARRLEMSVPAVGYAVRRGERIARENHYHLV